MTIAFQKTRYAVRFAQGAAELAACQRLRHRCFFGLDGLDVDPFDQVCRHLMVEDADGTLLATVRLFDPEEPIEQGYTAQFYDLSALAAMPGHKLELGRFCAAPRVQTADVLRAAWAALTRYVDQAGVSYLFGCSSFDGVDPGVHAPVFSRLAERHLGPVGVRPGRVAPERHQLTPCLGPICPLPPLLRSYLAMGAWVSDHAVIDRVMGTMHVFTCVEVAAVPPARAKALRTLALDPALP